MEPVKAPYMQLLLVSFFLLPNDTIDKCFPANGQDVCVSAVTVIHGSPQQSLTSPQGVLAWSAFVATWTARGMAKRHSDELVSGMDSSLYGLL